MASRKQVKAAKRNIPSSRTPRPPAYAGGRSVPGRLA